MADQVHQERRLMVTIDVHEGVTLHFDGLYVSLCVSLGCESVFGAESSSLGY